MNSTVFPVRLGLALAGGAFLLLTACAEQELILPGEREAIRGQIDGTRLEPTPDAINNISRPIQVPAARRSATWAQPPGMPSHRVDNSVLRVAPQHIWSANIGSGDDRRVRITADPVVAGGLIYTLDSGAQVSAVTPAGQVAWSVDLIPVTDDEEQATGGGMAYDNGTLYVSSGFGRLTALDAKTGGVRWTQKLSATGSGTPLISDGLVYLVAGDSTGWAIDAKDGRIKWQINAAPSVANVLGAPAPVIAGEFVVFAFGSGELIGAFRRGGYQRWSATVAGGRTGRVASRIGDITGSPMVVGNRIYAGNHSGTTSAISTDAGEVIWTARQGAVGPVWPVGGSVFAVSSESQLVRLDGSDGSVIWAVDLPGYLKDKPRKRGEIVAHYGPIMAGGQLVIASNDGFLRFVAPEDGSLIASVPVPGGATTAPVVADGTLYVVSTDGKLHAFR